VLDVKTGRGAFMQTHERARELAQTLVRIGTQFGKQTIGFITDMSQPLGMTIGNWLEVMESVECLRNNRGTNDASSDLMEVTHLLSGAMIMLGKKARTIEEGIEKSREAIKRGTAYETFLKLVRAHGGDTTVIEDAGLRQPLPKFSIDVKSFEPGIVNNIDALELGLASITLGAGREKIEDIIDPKAGIKLNKKVGDPVEAGDSLAVFYTDREDVLESVRARIGKAFRVGFAKPAPKPLVLDIVDKDGIRPWKSLS
jgi:pyrimidine-nucleoside phosphorylase